MSLDHEAAPELSGNLARLYSWMLRELGRAGLDRDADRWIAREAGSDGWLIKPLDALRLRRAALATLAGEAIYEGEPVEPAAEVDDDGAVDVEGAGEESEVASD